MLPAEFENNYCWLFLFFVENAARWWSPFLQIQEHELKGTPEPLERIAFIYAVELEYSVISRFFFDETQH